MVRIQCTQVVTVLMVCCHPWFAPVVSSQTGPDWLPMCGVNPACQDPTLDLYLYDMSSGNLRTVKQGCTPRTDWFGSMNESRSKMVYQERSRALQQSWIKVYDVATDNSTTVCTISSDDCHAAYFDAQGKIVFEGGDGLIKQMDVDGGNITTRIAPEPPYRLGVFWLSPDRQKLVAIENERSGDYETTNYERLVLFNADGSGRRILVERYLGEWNAVGWKPDSSAFIYYSHTFNGQPIPHHVKTPHYVTFVLSQDPIVRTDLSGSYLGSKEENVCFYTRAGNLLGILTRELYDAETGSLIADCSEEAIALTQGMMGTDPSGRAYFANPDGTQFHEFPECQYLGTTTDHVSRDLNWDGIVSIIGDVPPFVQVVYFGGYSGYDEQFPCKDPVLPGDCNHDGILSIIGDVPCFVQCVYFGNCPE